MGHIFEYRDADLDCHHTVHRRSDPVRASMHTHELLEVFYLLSGQGSYMVEGTRYEMHPHDLLVMRSAETHMLQMDEGTPYEHIVIHFQPCLLDGFDPHYRLLRPFFDRPLGFGNLYRPGDFTGGHWRAALDDFTFDDSAEVRSHIVVRLLALLPALCDAYDRRRGQPEPAPGTAAQLVAYVNAHLFEDISLQSVSRAFYRSSSQVSRIFRSATGSSLWEYVMLKRLLAARAMLQRGESAGSACAACGFGDYSAFFRAYKSHFGRSPKEDLVH